jgi:crotonobetainyl-CoA:carnitine CoA-transferase CaiB-like acyl-CoA transferase
MSDPAPPLAGLRVAEWAGGLAARYAGFLLAGLGAEVVTVEPPGARPSPGDHVLVRGKISADLDLARAEDAACWRALAGGADAVVVDEAGPPLADDAGRITCRLRAWDPGVPGAELPPDESLVAAACGVYDMQWSWAARPVWLVTPVIGYMTGLLAALGVTAAVLARRRGAPGQTVDVTGVGGAFALNSGTYVSAPDGFQGSLSRGGDPRGVYPTYCLYRTADGWLFVGALTQTFFVKLMTALGREDLLAHPRLQTSPLAFGPPEIRALVRGELDPIFARRPTAEWLRVLAAADVPCGPVQTREEFLHDPEAHALGLVAEVSDPVLGPTLQPPVPAAFSDTPAPPVRPAPRPGADTERVRREAPAWRRAASAPVPAPAACLAGVRVLDLTSFIAGPFCPMLLADLGADVVKIETGEGDPFRVAAFGFVGWNRGKRSLVLDLKRPEGCDVFMDLVRGADAVVDNFRAGVLARLGLGWERLHAANPRLVHTSITGYGPEGPSAARPGFDPVFQARSGLAAVQGGDDVPVIHMIAYNDYCAGALGALATVAALVARERTGRGQRVDVSLFRTAFVDQAAELISWPGRPAPVRGGRDHLGPSAGRRLYACHDAWLAVAATRAEHAAALGRLAGARVDLDDPAEGPAASAVAAALGAVSRATALERLAAAGVPAAACAAPEDLMGDPRLVECGALVEAVDPVLGRLRMTGPFVRFGATPGGPLRPAPALGADGAAVLGEAGYDAARIAALVAAGVVGAAP